jgi:hypothetical protein
MGATRGRLVIQLMMESQSLALASSAVGYLFAYVGLKAIVAAIPQNVIPSEATITLSPAALVFSLGATVLTAFICGLAPGLHCMRQDLILRAGGTGATPDVKHSGTRFFLVAAEIAISVVLLIGAGLITRTLLALKNVDIGFNPATVLAAHLSLPEGRYDKAEPKNALLKKILDQTSLIPGVVAAAEATSPPPYTWGWTTVAVRGESRPQNRNTASIMCSEGYFSAFRRRLLRGRFFSPADIESVHHVAVVNQKFVREHFRNADAMGRTIRFTDFETLPDWPHDVHGFGFPTLGFVFRCRRRTRFPTLTP